MMGNQFVSLFSRSSSTPYLPIHDEEETALVESDTPYELQNMTMVWHRSISMLNVQLNNDAAIRAKNETKEQSKTAALVSKSMPILSTKKVKVEKSGKVSNLVKMFSRLIIKDQESTTSKEVKSVKKTMCIQENKEEKLEEYVGIFIRRALLPLAVCHENSIKNVSFFTHTDLLKASTPLNENKIKIEKILDLKDLPNIVKEAKKSDDTTLGFLLEQSIAWFLLKANQLYDQLPKYTISTAMSLFIDGCSVQSLNRILSLFTSYPEATPLLFVKRMAMTCEKVGVEDVPAYKRLREMLEVLVRRKLIEYASSRTEVKKIIDAPISIFYEEPYKTAFMKFLSSPTRIPEFVRFMEAVGNYEDSFRRVEVVLIHDLDNSNIKAEISERKNIAQGSHEELARVVLACLDELNISQKKVGSLQLQVMNGLCVPGMFSKVKNETKYVAYKNFVEETSTNAFWYSHEFISMCLEHNIPWFMFKK